MQLRWHSTLVFLMLLRMSINLEIQKMILDVAQVPRFAVSFRGSKMYRASKPSGVVAPLGTTRCFALSRSHNEPPNLDRRWESTLKAAKEFEYPEPKAEVLACAKALFPDVLSGYRGMFDIYPTEDGEVVLDAYVRGEDHYSSVLLICRPDGQVLCSVAIGDDIRGDLFPGDGHVNSFIDQAFSDLQKELNQWHVLQNLKVTSDSVVYHTRLFNRP